MERNNKLNPGWRKKKKAEKMAAREIKRGVPKEKGKRITQILIDNVPGKLKEDALLENGIKVVSHIMHTDGKTTMNVLVGVDNLCGVKYLTEHGVVIPAWEIFTPEIQEYLSAAHELRKVNKELAASKPAIEEGKGKE